LLIQIKQAPFSGARSPIPGLLDEVDCSNGAIVADTDGRDAIANLAGDAVGPGVRVAYAPIAKIRM